MPWPYLHYCTCIRAEQAVHLDSMIRCKLAWHVCGLRSAGTIFAQVFGAHGTQLPEFCFSWCMGCVVGLYSTANLPRGPCAQPCATQLRAQYGSWWASTLACLQVSACCALKCPAGASQHLIMTYSWLCMVVSGEFDGLTCTLLCTLL